MSSYGSCPTPWASPSPLRIAEVGAGDGTLAVQLLDALADLDVDYAAIDVSPGARSALSTIDGVRAATDLADAPHVVIANELLDNLPFRRLRGDREIRIGMDGARFVEVEATWDGEPGPSDGEAIVPDGALAFIDRLASAPDARLRLGDRLRRRRLFGRRHPRLSRASTRR